MDEFISSLPEWAGTVPQWGMFFALLAVLVKQVIPWRQQTIDATEAHCNRLTKEVEALTERLAICEENCAKETRALQEEIYGLRRQHVQEQISLINTIMRSVNAPELKGMVDLLERVKLNLRLERAGNELQTNVGDVTQGED